MVRSEGDRLARVVVCSPRYEYGRASDLEKHNIGRLGAPEAAVRQHDKLTSRIHTFGAEVINIPELADHPNSVFTRDTALCTPQGYIRLRLGLETRQGEDEWMAQTLDALEEPLVGEITAPATAEGGDVVLAGKVAFVARSTRTNEEGIRQLSHFLTGMDYEIRVVHLPDTTLHLDKALMTLGPNRLIYCRELIPAEILKGFEALEISCRAGATANLICLGDHEVIVNGSNRAVIERLEAEAYVVHDLDLSEFAKGMGGPNCLIMPVARNF